MALYHFTCIHQAPLIERTHTLDPEVATFWHGIWLTDLEAAPREGLGLTSHTLDCDRTRYRFVVDTPVHVHRWIDVRREFEWSLREELERAAGALPMHWYFTRSVQRARLG
jgi:hypothetical protein